MQLFTAVLLVVAGFAVGCSARAPADGPLTTQAGRPSPGPKPQLLGHECRSIPDYPVGSVQRREAGTVVLVFSVDSTGKLMSSRVKQSSGYKELDNAALVALSKCPFLPAVRDGQAVAGEVEASYVWRLQ
jgi:periplasmic protein TonB